MLKFLYVKLYYISFFPEEKNESVQMFPPEKVLERFRTGSNSDPEQLGCV